MVEFLASASTFPIMASAFAKPDDVVVLACCSAMSAEERRTPLEPQSNTDVKPPNTSCLAHWKMGMAVED